MSKEYGVLDYVQDQRDEFMPVIPWPCLCPGSCNRAAVEPVTRSVMLAATGCALHNTDRRGLHRCDNFFFAVRGRPASGGLIGGKPCRAAPHTVLPGGN